MWQLYVMLYNLNILCFHIRQHKDISVVSMKTYYENAILMCRSLCRVV